jgi:hypothetical protein
MGKYDRYNSEIKRALRQGNNLKAIKAYLQKPENLGTGMGLYNAKIVIDKLAVRYKRKHKLCVTTKCPICGYDYEQTITQCPRCLDYYPSPSTI